MRARGTAPPAAGPMTVPVALTIAGSDSGGGAGIQADLKTFSALGVYGASAITAVTAQNTQTVTAVAEIDPAIVAAQVEAVLADFPVGAVKIGMLASPGIVFAVAASLGNFAGPIVLDPVMVAKSGAPLLPDGAVSALVEALLPRAGVITPNLPEAARLLDDDPVRTEAGIERQGRALQRLTKGAVLMKGGHAEGERCTDLLIEPTGQISRFSARRAATANTHGTGCTFSAAVAAGLAAGLPLAASVRRGHDYLQKAIGAADTLRLGAGRGPVHHFVDAWGRGG